MAAISAGPTCIARANDVTPTSPFPGLFPHAIGSSSAFSFYATGREPYNEERTRGVTVVLG
jgi:hypothetical protein